MNSAETNATSHVAGGNESEIMPPSKSQYRHACNMPRRKPRMLAPGVTDKRESLINMMSTKWANGTVLHFYFFDKETDASTVALKEGSFVPVPWRGKSAEMETVRRAFKEWGAVGIGLRFVEV